MNGWYTGTVTVTLTAADNDGGSGVAESHYTIDGGDQQTYSDPFPVPGDGSRTVTFWSTDAAGNVEDASSETDSVTFVIDTTPPTIWAPAALTFSRGDGVSMPYVRILLPYSITDAWSPTADVRITISSGNVKRKHPGSVEVFTFSGQPADVMMLVADLSLKLKKGTYRYTVAAADEAGNVSSPYAGRITVL